MNEIFVSVRGKTLFFQGFFKPKTPKNYENLDEKCDNFIEMDKFCHSVGL